MANYAYIIYSGLDNSVLACYKNQNGRRGGMARKLAKDYAQKFNDEYVKAYVEEILITQPKGCDYD